MVEYGKNKGCSQHLVSGSGKLSQEWSEEYFTSGLERPWSELIQGSAMQTENPRVDDFCPKGIL